ncbi:hypothetical protein LTR15_012681 [Elasticomyces elasticus]|nr:hypothetical protein LTR15_012681 [Elasticomyces elasticus]
MPQAGHAFQHFGDPMEQDAPSSEKKRKRNAEHAERLDLLFLELYHEIPKVERPEQMEEITINQLRLAAASDEAIAARQGASIEADTAKIFDPAGIPIHPQEPPPTSLLKLNP